MKHKKTSPAQVAWCDSMKVLLKGLVSYVAEFHSMGVAYDPKGADLEYKEESAAATPATGAVKKSGGGQARGGQASIMAELAKKSTGNSAAVGLKKVTKDQQTWRKEFSGGKFRFLCALFVLYRCLPSFADNGSLARLRVNRKQQCASPTKGKGHHRCQGQVRRRCEQASRSTEV